MKLKDARRLLVAIALASVFPVAALETVKPEKLGFSSQRLQRLQLAMNEKINNKEVAGAVTLLARHGKVVQFNSYGYQDIASATAMKQDAIFRIYSMTKPLISVAMMLLYEEGKWLPGDPIAKYIPEFKDLKVYAGEDKNGKPILQAPHHAPTVNELLTHTAGFTSGFAGSPVDKMYNNARIWEAGSFKEYISTLASFPLAHQPGEAWEYSVAADIQGYLIERLAGMPLAQFLEERIFKPLEMKDTGFFVPEQKLARLATLYQPDGSSPLAPMPRDPKVATMPAMPSGGGGLYSTAEDYFHFAQMLLNEGEFNGVHLLSPASVKLMRSNHLPETLQTGKWGVGPYRMQPGFGYGYNLGVIEDPLSINSTLGTGSYFWVGIAGTWFWVDPSNDLLFIGMVQRWVLAPGMPNLEDMSRALVYQALVQPKK